MCGIAGTIFRQRDQRGFQISELTRPLVHRGPDGAGQYTFENIHLGHRRLAIIDLQTGNGPGARL
jgi:asparagine synthase (glutamine-hydrolysing)